MGRMKVGYKKPPVHSRFKKGVSGNPKGRPRKPKRPRCDGCRFFRRASELGGQCTRYPPQVVWKVQPILQHDGPHIAFGQPMAYWPFVTNDEHCGEFKRG